MAGSAFSEMWYRVADLRPRLRGHAELHRHVYRGKPWYVLQDHASGQFHRFSPEAYRLIGLIDGSRTLQSVWEVACAELGDDMPTQDEVIELVAKLHRANVLQADLPPDVEEIAERGGKLRRRRWIQQLRSPLGIRIPLLDPERFLAATEPVARWMFSWLGALVWLVVVGYAAVLAVIHWEPLANNVTDNVLSVENLVLLWLVYPVVKVVHELGHGYAVKRWGGEVHEMGVMLLVFMPVPYVDASAASAFASKYRRALVGAAGIAVEVLIAAVALLVWVEVEAGTVRAVAFNVMIIAGVSTVLFNGNPLLRFDAYYVLCDLVEIPNLGNRGNQYLGYLAKRLLFGARDARSPAGSAGEAAWLGIYAVAAFVYRMFIMVAIVLFVAGQFFVAGVLLAIWSTIGVLVLPFFQMLGKTFRDPELRRRPKRLALVTFFLAAIPVAAVGFVPVPLATRAEGVVWPAEDARVRAKAKGFVTELLVAPGARVAAGQALVRTEDPALTAEVGVLLAQIAEAEARAQASRRDRTEQAVIEEEVRYLRGELARAEERRAELTIRSPAAGVLVLPRPADLASRFVARGEQLGYVVDFERLTLRVPVPQADVDLVRHRTRSVEARFASRVPVIHRAVVETEVPGATRTLPSPVLAVDGGGRIARDPGAGEALEAYERYFYFVVAVPGVEKPYVEERAHVLFRHPPEPISMRWYRGLRRLLLSHFDA